MSPSCIPVPSCACTKVGDLGIQVTSIAQSSSLCTVLNGDVEMPLQDAIEYRGSCCSACWRRLVSSFLCCHRG